MSRYLLAIGVCTILGTTAAAEPAGMTITTSGVASADATNVALIKQELAARLAKTSCDGCHIDASITKLVVEASATESAVTASINITISDDRGVMLSVLSGGARAAIPNPTPRASRLASLRAEALTAAVDGMTAKVARSLKPAQVARPADAWLVTMLRGWLTAPLPTS